MTTSAAFENRVPATTLFNHLSGKSSSIGAGFLSHAEERAGYHTTGSTRHCFWRDKRFYWCSLFEGSANTSKPVYSGYSWRWLLASLHEAMESWAQYMQIAAPAYQLCHCMATETINIWFDKLESLLTEIGLPDLPQDVLEHMRLAFVQHKPVKRS